MAADTPDSPTPSELSPIYYDDQALHPTRKVKPLPKRRRVIDPVMTPASESAGDSVAHLPPADLSEAADQLAEALSTGMALQSQYQAPFSSVQDLLLEDDMSARPRPTEPFAFRLPDIDSLDDGDRGDGGDYVDHLQQPENKKKRKVPGVSRFGDDRLGAEDDLADSLLFGQDRRDLFDSLTGYKLSTPSLDMSLRRMRLTRASRAALQQKEILKSRKRQLANVLGALSLGDNLALDQALSSNYPLARLGKGENKGPYIRLSRRLVCRKARAHRLAIQSRIEDPPSITLPPFVDSAYPFAFECDSATSERLRATKDEVAFLHDRFETELSRQAAKATELAKEAAALATKAKQHERSRRRARNGADGGQRITDAGLPNDVDKATGTPLSKNKKKKRSALANASNPHHLRNYVPSRLPNSGPASTHVNPPNSLGLFPLRFLSADLPPRRGKPSNGSRRNHISDPSEEWICALCEYKLFYGVDEHERRRAVRNRKKILSRRRRAMERAAAAASGVKLKAPPPAPLDGHDEDSAGDELEDELDNGPFDTSSPSKQAKLGTQQERDRDKEVHK